MKYLLKKRKKHLQRLLEIFKLKIIDSPMKGEHQTMSSVLLSYLANYRLERRWRIFDSSTCVNYTIIKLLLIIIIFIFMKCIRIRLITFEFCLKLKYNFTFRYPWRHPCRYFCRRCAS